jgi:N utilization substance protein B
MTMATPGTKPKTGMDRRTAARIAAVQALYQSDMNSSSIDDVVAEFAEHRPRVEIDEAPALKVDSTLFAAVATGAAGRRAEIDPLVTAALADDWTMDRLEMLLRAVLRAGTFELLARPDTPAKVVINQYVDVAHAFFGRGEPGLVNGVLDRLAHQLRADEFAEPVEALSEESS